MHAKLVALFLVTSHLGITDTVVNTYGKKRTKTNDEIKLDHRPKIRYGNETQVRPLDVRDLQHRFIDGDWNNSPKRIRKVTAPVAGVKTTTESSSFFDYFDQDEDKDEEEEEEVEEEADEDEEDEEDDENEYEDEDKKKNPPSLRGVRRKHVRTHKIIFPLLLAYKLKFFTMLPLLVGSLVLLMGTTSVAGFFFALFSAALGLQVKARH